MENRKIKSSMILSAPTLTSVSNFAEVLEEWSNDYGEMYGDVASVLYTNKEYIPKRITQADYDPPNIEGEEPMPDLTANQKNKIRESCIMQRNTEISKNRLDLKKMFKGIWKRCSLESQEKIKERGGTAFTAAELSNDTVSLITWIKESHSTAVMGRGPQMVAINRENALSALGTLFQQSESVTTFAKLFQNAVNASVASGNEKLDEPALALRFLGKLNSTFAPMNREMTMKAMMNDENSHPKTLSDAIYLAANWIPLVDKELQHQAFTTSDARTKDKNEVRNNKNEVRSEEKTRKDLNKNDRSVGEKEKGQKQNDRKDETKKETIQQKRYSREWYTERDKNKICTSCNKKGHMWQGCPDLKERFNEKKEETLTTNARKDRQPKKQTFDDEEWEENTYVITPTQETTIHHQSVFISTPFSEDILGLDTMSSINIMSNKSILTNIQPSQKTISIGGVNSTSPRFRVTEKGLYNGIPTYYHPDVACNILSFSELIKLKTMISYNTELDYFIVLPPDSCCIHTFHQVKAGDSEGTFYINRPTDRKTHYSRQSAIEDYKEMKIETNDPLPSQDLLVQAETALVSLDMIEEDTTTDIDRSEVFDEAEWQTEPSNIGHIAALFSLGQTLDREVNHQKTTDRTLVTTVAENMEYFTKRQLRDATRARQYQGRMLMPTSAMLDVVSQGTNFPFTVEDIKNADFIYGTDANIRRGNAVWQQRLNGIKIARPLAQK
jgi:hypothetical protein